MNKSSDQPKVSKLELENFKSPQKPVSALDLKRLNDVSIELRAELGRCKVSLREILSWKENSILTLNKLAGENVDIYVRDTRFASGEVLVVEDNFAVAGYSILEQVPAVGIIGHYHAKILDFYPADGFWPQILVSDDFAGDNTA